MDDGFLAITVPFPIRMFGTTTTTPSIQSNGVRVSCAYRHPEYATNSKLDPPSLLVQRLRFVAYCHENSST